MLKALPAEVQDIRDWSWEQWEPFFKELEARPLTAENVHAWLEDLDRINNLIGENFSRARVATTQDTSDEQAEAYLKHLMATLYPPMTQMHDRLNRKLVDSGFEPENFAYPLKRIRNQIELFREANIPLTVRDQALGLEYAKITGAQSVIWEGEERTLEEMRKVFEDSDRDKREQAWHLTMDRWLQDREAINALWVYFYDVRQEMAQNAGFDNYRDFRWQQFNRFDYSPQDTETFHAAIEEVVVPAAMRANERRRSRLGLASLRPWDLDVDPHGKPPLRPWQTIEEFSEKAENVFTQVDPALGEYYGTMRRENLLDLPNRKHKGPGAYCTAYPHIKRPFIFMNAIGKRDDVRTLLHEAGHAFHNFEAMANLPFNQQRAYPIEYGEVASMSMELLAAPYLSHDHGGYFTSEESARDRVSHLEKIIYFWPYMAVVDSFQQWAYTHPEGRDPGACDQKWSELWDRFIHVDYTDLEDVKATGWHRKQHIFRYPLYYVEYGLAQLGAVQVWANALRDQQSAVNAYRSGLSLGGTRSIPELYAATGVKFAFDAPTLQQAITLVENTISELEAV